MNQQIADADNRIIFFFPDAQIDPGSVFFEDNPMQRHRQGNPLILLDTTVIMRIHQRQAMILIERMLLHIQTR